ncbi:class A beta-lactamase-related serine hydrolase [Nocardioides eburneiflavus]|uniref:Class A beta-lactamase-related serine hydrolase n=1 Tax=Nocardioides eburneiflavus TaxID=2518372 RepID=A0A4Z1CJ50_9ACTN|nr:serine hydrolase domain-containing protein [Nocardioides eburneiflavus]TGN63050.1 class A beta-lactamase-related serine hydrolase [Nocardioides eburneiflavus]
MKTLVTMLVVGLATALPVSAPDDSVEDVIDGQMGASGAPGLAYAVVADGEITSAGARGVVELGSDEEVTPDTPFLTGSISKSFTALSVMQLVEAGRVDLDAAVLRYLEDFTDSPAGDVTLRQLLSHTSGFSTLQGNISHTDMTGEDDELAERVARLAEAGPAHADGERWEYSNANYQVLGRVVEVVSGQSYQAYVTEHVLEPLGMRDSFVADGRFHADMATGHRPWFGTKRPLSGMRTQLGTAPQGGIVASANDVARFLQTMVNGRADVLSAEVKAEMMRPASTASPFYGLGWFVDAGNGTVWHSGASPGYETLATMLPSENKAVVVLVNAGSGLGFGETTQLRNAITAQALGLDYAGEGSHLAQKALFIGLLLLPGAYTLSMAWAWRHRADLRAKSGAFGLFSLWFPLLTTVAAAGVIVVLVPEMYGTPLSTITLFQPDLGFALTATAATGVLWAAFRLALFHTRGTDRPDGRQPLHAPAGMSHRTDART